MHADQWDSGVDATTTKAPVMSGWTPETLTTSPGALAIFEFDPNNPSDIVQTSTGTVVRVINSLDRTEALTPVSASGGTAVLLAANSGADGTKRVLQFHASTINSNSYDPSSNWLAAGG